MSFASSAWRRVFCHQASFIDINLTSTKKAFVLLMRVYIDDVLWFLAVSKMKKVNVVSIFLLAADFQEAVVINTFIRSNFTSTTTTFEFANLFFMYD